MKRTLAVAAMLGLAAGLASADVQSVNTVGYKTMTINPGFNYLSLNWVKVQTGAEALSINDLFDNTEEQANLTVGADLSNADSIRVWNQGALTYDNYLYRTTTAGTGWTKGTAAKLTTVEIPLGVGFWLYKQGTASKQLSFAAQVKETGPFEHVLEPGFQQIGSAYAADMPLNAASGGTTDWSGAKVGVDVSDADSIRVWTGMTYDNYLYRTTTAGTGWTKGTAPKLATYTIPLGVGAWYYRQPSETAVTFEQAKPY